jgi:hypothetical protein
MSTARADRFGTNGYFRVAAKAHEYAALPSSSLALLTIPFAIVAAASQAQRFIYTWTWKAPDLRSTWEEEEEEEKGGEGEGC